MNAKQARRSDRKRHLCLGALFDTFAMTARNVNRSLHHAQRSLSLSQADPYSMHEYLSSERDISQTSNVSLDAECVEGRCGVVGALHGFMRGQARFAPNDRKAQLHTTTSSHPSLNDIVIACVTAIGISSVNSMNSTPPSHRSARFEWSTATGLRGGAC